MKEIALTFAQGPLAIGDRFNYDGKLYEIVQWPWWKRWFTNIPANMQRAKRVACDHYIPIGYDRCPVCRAIVIAAKLRAK